MPLAFGKDGARFRGHLYQPNFPHPYPSIDHLDPLWHHVALGTESCFSVGVV